MKMKLQEYASFAEIISSLAVLLTLVFFVVELRESTEVTRSAAFGNTTEQLTSLRLTVISDELLSAVWQEYLTENIESQTQLENLRLNGIVLTVLAIYEDAYYSYDYGIMGEREWSRFPPRICQHYERLQRLNLNSWFGSLTPEFSKYVENQCAP